MACRICFEDCGEALGCACRGDLGRACAACIVQCGATRDYSGTCEICGFQFSVAIDLKLKRAQWEHDRSPRSGVMLACAEAAVDPSLSRIKEIKSWLPGLDAALTEFAHASISLACIDLEKWGMALLHSREIKSEAYAITRAHSLICNGYRTDAKKILDSISQDNTGDWLSAQNLALISALEEGKFEHVVSTGEDLLPQFYRVCGPTHNLTIDTAITVAKALLHLNLFSKAADLFATTYKACPSPLLAMNLAVTYLFAKDVRAIKFAELADWGPRPEKDPKSIPAKALNMLATGRGKEALSVISTLD